MSEKVRKPILLIDMDGVIANYYARFLELWTAEFPDRKVLRPDELTSMYFEECYPEDYMVDIRRITCDIGFFETLPEIAGASGILNKILDEGKFEPFLCSTPDSSSVNHVCTSEKMRWVEGILGKRWLKRTILTHDKTLVAGDFLIDDKPDIKGINPTPTWEHVVFTHNYNKHLKNHRIDNWDNWAEVESLLLGHFYRNQ